MAFESLSRREFIGAAVSGMALAAAAPIFGAMSPAGNEKKMPAIFVCGVCGHVEFGAAPDHCPVCHAPKDKFIDNGSLFADAMEHWKGTEPLHEPDLMVMKKSKWIAEKPTDEIMVRIGKKLHPMEADHWIQWIDCYVDDKYFARTMVTPGSEPAVTFYPKMAGKKVRVVCNCNLHGHWQAEAAL